MNRITLALLAGVATLGFMTSVQAADLIIEEPAAPGYVDVSGSWDGVFVGVFGGYAWGTFVDSVAAEQDVDGWLLGVNAGVNFTLTEGIVAGVVGDIAWNDISGGGIDVNWDGSVRGRLGFDGGAFLPYVTGGLAFANAEIGGVDNTHLGWTVGAGVEFAATEDLSIDLQYRYTAYDEQNYGAAPLDAVDFTSNRVTAGLNWKF